jgi:chemotaxis protein methyltransferase WspC
MAVEEIKQLLKSRMGLHSATVGSGTVVQAVAQRMRDCGIDDTGDYFRMLQHSGTELDALIEAVVIPETWFYRDLHPFAAFCAWLKENWLPCNTPVPLRLLSVPCSTGEEPYSLAMCLSDIGLPATAAHVDGVDISHRNIEKAQRGVYGSNSFRGTDLAFRDRYFTTKNQRYRLSEEIRQRVSFERANILDDGFLQQRPPYHVIFCRNLLIYFDRPTQNAAIERLEQLLTADGVLFLGHSETSLLLDRDFSPLGYPRCFAFRRGRHSHCEDGGQAPPAGRPRAHKPRRQQPRRPQAEDTPRPFSDHAATALPPVEDDSETLLQQAFQLADQGHLDEAALRCETLLQRPRHQADAHYLLGLIRDATGNRRAAEQHLRKAVYLNPDHYEALAHLGVICQQNGDTTGAQRFRQRADRIQQRNAVLETD